MKALYVLLGALIVLVVTGTTFAQGETGQDKTKSAPSSWQATAVADGADLYRELCAACHGKGGRGDGPTAGELKKMVPDLTRLAARNNGLFPRDTVQDSIAGESPVLSHGTAEMPIWGQVFENERPDRKMFERKALAKQRLYNLTEYLATIQAK
ncbi:MAG: c-type cytochrome [Gammaproteobacteria bacterium]|nr:c-type cytochrome [Gammaproteobacteria bacterium]